MPAVCISGKPWDITGDKNGGSVLKELTSSERDRFQTILEQSEVSMMGLCGGPHGSSEQRLYGVES